MEDEDQDDMDSFFAEVNAIPVETETVESETISASPLLSSDAADPSVPAAVPVIVVGPAGPPPPSQAQPQPELQVAPPAAGPKVAAHHLPISFASKTISMGGGNSSSSSSSSSIRGGIQQMHYARPPGQGFATGFTTTYVTKTAPPPPPPPLEVKARQAAPVRTGAGDVWVDPTLAEWPDNDYRIFVGDLSKECRDEQLGGMFSQYKSFARARVVRSAFDQKGKGYGFVSFLDPMDCAKAIREMNGKYCGARPMKITKSTWEDRNLKEVKKKAEKKRKIEEALGIA